jgi:hypothetical protein
MKRLIEIDCIKIGRNKKGCLVSKGYKLHFNPIDIKEFYSIHTGEGVVILVGKTEHAVNMPYDSFVKMIELYEKDNI